MLALVLIAGSLGLDNFAAAIAIGLSGVDARLRLKVAFAFGFFEAAMPVIGLLLGRQAAHGLGSHANLLAGGLLVATGLVTMFISRHTESAENSQVRDYRMRKLLVTGAALSIDNLVVGFALGAYKVSFPVAVAIIATVSVGMALAGLELGERLGRRIERDSELLGGAVLIAVGVVTATGVL
jgi:putative Mn2+ efflux pump MntP